MPKDFWDSIPNSQNDFWNNIPNDEKSVAGKATALITPQIEPGESVVKSAGESVKEMFVPTMDTVKRALNPNIGQAGILRQLEQAGQNVGQAVRSVAEKFPAPAKFAADVASTSLTPTAFQQQAGAEGMAPAASALVRGAGKTGAFLSQLLSGVPAQDLAKVVDRPGIYGEGLARKFSGTASSNLKNVGADMGEAAYNQGFTKEATIAPEVLDQINPRFKDIAGRQNPFTGKGSIAEGYFERVAKGENLSLPETYDAYQAVRDVTNKTARKGDATFATMSKFQRALQDELKSASKSYREAAQLYERAATGRKVTNILPRTETGKVSQGRLAFNSLLTGGSLFMNPLAALGSAAVTAPITHGGIAAGFGVGAKAAGAATRGVPAVMRNFLRKK